MIDPSSGKFIVADILPPQKKEVHVAASRPGVKKPVAKKQAPKQKQLTRDESALDAWFRKERGERIVPPAHHKTAGFFQRNKRWLAISIAGIVLIAGGYGIVAQFFTTMTVSIILASETYTLDHEVTVMEEPSRADIINGDLITLTKEAERAFPATGMEDVRNKAKGTITIYNAFNSQPQVLVATTRFQAPDGKIYRIAEPVTVPPATIENGVLSPSSIEAVVYADEPGKTYNKQELIEFTIPGFKGSPRYEGFYARAKTPMAGGYIGTTTVVTKEDADGAQEELLRELQMAAIEELSRVVPDDLFLLDGSYEVVTDTQKTTAEAGDVAESFTQQMTVSARALVFSKKELARHVATLAEMPTETMRLVNEDAIIVEVIRRNIENGTLVLRITGEALFAKIIDTSSLAEDLAGKSSVDSFDSAFQSYEGIKRAEVSFSPSWVQKIPKRAENIVITTSY